MNDLERRFGRGRGEGEDVEEDDEDVDEGEEEEEANDDFDDDGPSSGPGGGGGQEPSPGRSSEDEDEGEVGGSNACFYCNKQGHWQDSCPVRRRHEAEEQQWPQRSCPRCKQTCLVKTSRSQANPDRQYYRCSNCPSGRPFVAWCDGRSW